MKINDLYRFQKFLIALRDECGCRLIGSLALGTHDLGDHVSDVDLVCADKRVDDFGEVIHSPIQQCITVFERFNVPWESILIGSIGSPRDLTTLPRPVEVMEECMVQEWGDGPSVSHVNVMGVVFRTFKEREHEPKENQNQN